MVAKRNGFFLHEFFNIVVFIRVADIDNTVHFRTYNKVSVSFVPRLDVLRQEIRYFRRKKVSCLPVASSLRDE